LHELAEEERADAVVLGSGHRGALGRVMAGGVAERLLHGAPCPVAVAPLGYADRPRPTGLAEIAAADDGDAEARLAVRAAVALAERTGARLTVIRVVPTATQLNPVPIDGYAYGVYLSAVREEAERELNETIDAVGGKVRARGLLLEGDPADEIAARSGTLDLLVLGSRGYGPVRRVLLGSVSTRVMRSADCPVLVVPRSGKEHMLEEVEPGSRAVNRE
jgi:nucleotide-binding universal stress UspA family protein